MNIDPLRPYIGLAKVLGYLLIASVLLFGGCSWGRSIEREAQSALIAKKDAKLSELTTLVNGAASALDEVNRTAAQEQAASEEKQREADFAKERALMAAQDLRRKLKSTEQDLIDAMRDPGCRAELERTTCAVLR
jgi:hypothetical protein